MCVYVCVVLLVEPSAQRVYAVLIITCWLAASVRVLTVRVFGQPRSGERRSQGPSPTGQGGGGAPGAAAPPKEKIVKKKNIQYVYTRYTVQ